MDGLPTELLSDIVGYCDHASQKQLRLVNKVLEDLASPNVFAHVYSAMFKDELLKFQGLSNSRLAKHVKKLTYFIDALPELDRKTYEKCISFRPDFHEFRDQHADEFPDEPQTSDYDPDGVFSQAWRAWEQIPCHTLSKAEIDRGWRTYRGLYRQQKSWKDNVQGNVFQQSFANMPNLVEVQAVRAMSETRNTSEWPLWRRLRKTLLLGPDDWRELYTPEPNERRHEFVILEHGVLCLLEAMAARNRHLGPLSTHKPISKLLLQDQFVGRSALWDNWANSLHGTAPASEEWSVTSYAGPLPLATAFSHLTDLVIWFSLEPAFEHGTNFDGAMFVQVHHFLHSATRLRRLTLILEDDAQFDHDLNHDLVFMNGAAPSVDIFDTRVALWPDIQHLTLSVNVQTTKLLPFLQLHASTLRSLRLSDMRVGDSVTLIKELPRILSLDSVYLGRLWHEGPGLPDESYDDGDPCLLSHGSDFNAPYEQSVLAYLLRKTDAMPDLSLDCVGRLMEHQRTDAVGPCRATVFRPHDNYEHKIALFQPSP